MRINTRKKIGASLALVGMMNFSLINFAEAMVYTVKNSQIPDQNVRKWTVDTNSILEVTTNTATGALINGNGLDGHSLRVTINDDALSLDDDVFVTSLDALISEFDSGMIMESRDVSGQFISVVYALQENWLSIRVESLADIGIKIDSDLGSDSNTVFTTINDKVFSYEKDGDNMGSGPIFQWETDGLLTNPLADNVQITKTGNLLELKLYVYAHDISNNRSANRIDYLQQFALFVAEENINRTDTFIYVAPPPPPAPMPVAVALRQSSNLSFDQSQHGSDTLSDPDGQLRKTLDSINAKYGNLIQ
jgi:hypothetical protein